MDLRSSSTVKQRPKGQGSSKPDWVYADETVTAGPPELKQRHPGKSGSDGEDGGSPVRHIGTRSAGANKDPDELHNDSTEIEGENKDLDERPDSELEIQSCSDDDEVAFLKTVPEQMMEKQ